MLRRGPFRAQIEGMRRPLSSVQLTLIDLPLAPALPGVRSRGPRLVATWKQAQAAANARSSEVLLAEIDKIAMAPLEAAVQLHAANRPHPPALAADGPPGAIEWRAEALAELFEAIERASPGEAARESNTVRRAAG